MRSGALRPRERLRREPRQRLQHRRCPPDGAVRRWAGQLHVHLRFVYVSVTTNRLRNCTATSELCSTHRYPQRETQRNVWVRNAVNSQGKSITTATSAAAATVRVATRDGGCRPADGEELMGHRT